MTHPGEDHDFGVEEEHKIILLALTGGRQACSLTDKGVGLESMVHGASSLSYQD
jgi:hypothetical protein